MKIFVYGTLKKGFGNHRVLGDAKFLCEDITLYPYIMLDAGFPVVLPRASRGHDASGVGAGFITGEVYEIPDDEHGANVLSSLDGLEGEGRMYHRRVTMTQGGHMVSMYIGDSDCWRNHPRDISKSTCVKVNGNTVTYVRD